MNYTVITIEALMLIAVFTPVILVPLKRNPLWWIHDYPQDIQDEYFKTHPRLETAFFSKTVLAKKGFALLLCLFVLCQMIRWSGASGFCSAFAVSYGLWSAVNWYDCFILDWVFFANMKSIRLPGTEHMDKAYHQKKYHFIRALYGMLIGLIPSVIASGLFALIYC